MTASGIAPLTRMDDLPRGADVKHCRHTHLRIYAGSTQFPLGLDRRSPYHGNDVRRGSSHVCCVDRRDVSAHCTGCLVGAPKGASKHILLISRWRSSMLTRLCSDSLFNLA